MRKLTKKRSFAFLCPELAKEWDYEKNYPLRPEDVFRYGRQKVGWKCKMGHRYMARIADRRKKCGCPYCSGHKVCKDNCLATINPELAKEWDYEKNYPLTPEDVLAHSRKRVGWICKEGHKYDAIIANRSKGIKNRSKGSGCPYCATCGKKVCKDNCLATVNPEIADEWDYDKNGSLTPKDVTSCSRINAYWICKICGYKYSKTVEAQVKHHICHNCNSLALKNPELASEWHPTKNGKLTPYDVASHSGKRAGWICKKGHVWFAQIYCRSNGNGCPSCSCHKIELKDGTIWDSRQEVYYYKTELKDKKIKFKHHVKIGLGACVCDFYIPSTNTYIETTGYTKKSRGWKEYHKNILRKKRYITKTLKANFLFVQLKLTSKQIQYVRENSV